MTARRPVRSQAARVVESVRTAEVPPTRASLRRVPTMVALPRDGGVLAHASVAHFALERAAGILSSAAADLPMRVSEALEAELRQAALHVDLVATEAARLPRCTATAPDEDPDTTDGGSAPTG